jgi:hypothetical protein
VRTQPHIRMLRSLGPLMGSIEKTSADGKTTGRAIGYSAEEYFLADPRVLTGLIAKRAEIAGQIEHTQDNLWQLVINHIRRGNPILRPIN